MRYLVRWLLVGILIVQGAAAAARPYSLDDLLSHEEVGKLLFDARGRWLLFEKYEPHLAMTRQDRLSMGPILRAQPFIVDLHGSGPARPLLPGNAPGTILLGLSPSGKRVAVARLEQGSYRFGIVTLATGSVRWWPYAPAYDGFHTIHSWLSDDRLLILTRNDDRPAGRLGLDWPPERLVQDRWNDSAAGRLAVTVSGSGRYLRSQERADQQLLLIEAMGDQPKILASGHFEQVQVSPGGRWAALVQAGHTQQPTSSDAVHEDDAYFARNLRLLDIASGQQWLPCSRCNLPGDPRWSDDGSQIAFVADRDGRREAMLADVGRHQLAERVGSITRRGPTCRLAAHQNVPIAARASVTSTQDETSFSVPMTCKRSLPVTDPGWGKVQWRANGDRIMVEVPSGDEVEIAWKTGGSVSLVQAVPLQTATAALFRISAASGHNALFLVNAGRSYLLMDLNKGMQGVEPALMRSLVHRSIDGSPVTSWLVLPPGQAHVRKLPMVVIPYPGQVYGDTAPNDQQVGRERFYTNAQLLAASGFAVLLPSLPMPAILPDAGFDFAAALAPAIEAAMATGCCNPDGLALWGHSYGGYSVAMAAAQSERFRAIVASAGIYDLAATAGTFGRQTRLSPEEGLNIASSYAWAEVGQGRMGVAPWLAPQRYTANSPIYLASRLNIPMLILGADRDFSPVEQGEQLFSALFRQGKDAQLVTYWGEGHVIGNPANLRDFYARVIGFLRENLRPERLLLPGPAGDVVPIHAANARR